MDIEDEFDYVFSIGVIHHIPDAQSAVKNIYKSLKKVWLIIGAAATCMLCKVRLILNSAQLSLSGGLS